MHMFYKLIFAAFLLLSLVKEQGWHSGSRDGAVVRALASHQCGPCSIPCLGIICGLSLLLVLVPAPRVFLRVLQFSSLRKNQHFQIPIRPGSSGVKSQSVDSTEISIYLIFYFFYFFKRTMQNDHILGFVEHTTVIFFHSLFQFQCHSHEFSPWIILLHCTSCRSQSTCKIAQIQ